ncbi:MAG TPA: PilZ domain-containing protein [Acidobacteriota bacterium]|nr:PilZ domain-containing protein [Acidobacteriota bacterium]
MSIWDWWRKRRRVSGGSRIDIEETDAVRRKISELCLKRRNCELRIDKEVFTSIFLSSSDKHFFIDIMMPTYGNKLIKQGEPTTLGYQERAIPYSMECRFLGKEKEEGYDALKFEMPQIIRHSNRRGLFRVAPARSRPMRIIIDFGMNQNIDTDVRDISGAGVAVSSSVSRYVGIGQKVKSVEIEMPDGSWVICSGIIRRVSGTTVGIELDEIIPQDRSRIFRYVNQRQKEDLSSRRLK